MPRRMTDFLDEAVKTHPDKVAFYGRRKILLTYKELQEEAYRIAMPIIKRDFVRNQWPFILISLFIVFHL